MEREKPPSNPFVFTTVFTLNVWLCLAAAIIGVSVLVWQLDKWSPYSPRNTGKPGRLFTLKESMWFTVGTLAQTGAGDGPSFLSGRLLVASFWFFSTIIMASYTADLAAFLTVSRMSVPVDSIDDLATQTQIKYSCLNNSYAESYFFKRKNIEQQFYELWRNMSRKMSETEQGNQYPYINQSDIMAVWEYPLDNKYTRIWETMQKTGAPLDIEDAIRRVRTQKYAFIHDTPSLKYEELKSCSLVTVGKQFGVRSFAFAVRESSPLKNEISSMILAMQRESMLEKFKSVWWPTNRTCTTDVKAHGINLNSVGGVFILMLVGIGIGLFALLFDIFWHRCIKKSKSHNLTVAEAVKITHPVAAISVVDGPSTELESVSELQPSTSAFTYATGTNYVGKVL